MKDETREQMRKFLVLCVEQDLAIGGEDGVERWDEIADDPNHSVYHLDETDRRQIKTITAEYFVAREREEEERERRRLEEERADEIMANHYVERIKKIVLPKLDRRFLPKPKPTAARRKGN